MLLLGIGCGIGAAALQSMGYLFSRIYVKRGGTPLTLMVASQLLTGVISLPFALFFWVEGFWRNPVFWLALFGVSFGASGGELMFFRAEEKIAPSRLASLMGLRIVTLAVLTALTGVARYDWGQVGGIALAAVSAFVLNYQKRSFNWGGMGNFAWVLFFYAISDFSIHFLIRSVDRGNLFAASLLALSLDNLLIALGMLPFFWLRHLGRNDLKASVPYTSVWFSKQILLYFCYGAIGPVFGNVVMASRGVLAILLTWLFLHLGVQNLERPKSRLEWLQRAAGALLMTAAILLYSLSGNHADGM